MAVIGNLVANLVADTSGFTRPMIAASAVVGNVSSSVASAAATAAGGFGKLATSSAKASVDVSRGMSNIIKAVGAATGSMGIGLAKAVAVTRESGAKVAAIQAKTEAQLARQQARMMKGAVSGGVLSGLAKFTAITYALKGLTSSFAGMVSGAIDAQKSGAKLDAVLASTGGAAGVSGEEIRKLAGDLQLVTDFEADATIGAAGVLATFTQIKGDVFKDAIVSAQNLSAVMGQDLQSSVVQIGKALNDPLKGITALSRVGVSFTQQQKDQIAQMVKAGNVAGAQAIILQELQTEFGGAAEAMSSPFTRIGNIVGDVVEGIGAVFLPTLESVASMITAAIVPAAEGMGEKFAAAGSSLKSVVVPAVQMAIAIVSNLGTAVDLLLARVNLAMVQTANQVSYVFTEKLPAIIAWFFDNWGAFWRDLVEIQRAQLRNMLLNIGDNIAMIIDYIQSGGTTEWKFVWTPLTDGFQSTMSKLPKIAERVPSQLEKALGGMVSDLEGKLEADMAATMEGLQAEVEKKPITPRIKPPPGGDTVTPTETKAVGAAQAGTREALSAIFSSMRGADLQAEMLAIQERQLQTQQEQLDALNGLNENQGVEIEP